MSLKIRAGEYVGTLQESICTSLETLDAGGKFSEDSWTHEGGGGGRTRIFRGGGVFEKAGVNVSTVDANLSEALAGRLNVRRQKVFAAGLSLVLHPLNPFVPTVHMNVRYLELENGDAWFGGGADLTPCYLFEEDARHFHTVLKRACDGYSRDAYEKFKKACDEYFFLKHRNEGRGVGGIFFDYLREDPERIFLFVQAFGNSFTAAYEPIVRRRKDLVWKPEEKTWQLMRRGRYVEFNLLYDRGTLFGLETGGRTESILMSLPPEVRWEYDFHPQPGTREAGLVNVLQHPKAWA